MAGFAQMTQTIEEAVKALAEFEAELERIKSEASEAKKRLLKTATDEAERAKLAAVAKAQRIADERLKVAKREAEKEAESIARKGEASLNELKATISRRKAEAVELAMRRLLGG